MSDEIKLLFIWQPKDELIQHLENALSDLNRIQFVIPPDFEEKTLMKFASDANIIMGWRPTLTILENAPELSLFINPGAGIQNLVEMFRELNQKRSVTLINNHGNAYFTAQHGVGILLALMNRIVPYHNQMAGGGWRENVTLVHSITLRNRNVGLLGYGAVNQQIHRLLSGFDLEFSILRRDWIKQAKTLPSVANKYNIDQLEKFLKWTDTLIISVPLTKLTKGLIRTRELELLGSNGIIVNLARGLVVDQESLYHACKDKTIHGAAIDVWYEYNPEPDEDNREFPYTFPFHELDNVVLSPHRAASPFNDLRRWDDVIENIRRFALGRTDYLNVVSLDDEY